MSSFSQKLQIPARLSNFINGKLVPPISNKYIDVICPIDEGKITELPDSSKQDVEIAVKAARQCFDEGTWSDLPGKQRALVLRKLADGLEKQSERLAQIESLNGGKPQREAEADIADTISTFRFYANLAEEYGNKLLTLPVEKGGLGGEEIQVSDTDLICDVYKEPRGVIAAITPWNYPLLIVSWKIAPILASGCTVVLKPSELTPCTAFELAKIAADVPELPPGALNIVFGLGSQAGNALTSSSLVDKITFTGSPMTGKSIMSNASQNLVPVSLELGGKSAMIVLPDALDDLVQWIMMGIFFNSGQVCSATSRLFIPEESVDKFIGKLVEATKKIKMGSSLDQAITDESVEMGPIISKGQFEKVRRYIQTAIDDGAIVWTGGLSRPTTRGYYVEPTILEVNPSSLVWNEEIFGPVLCIHRYSNLEKAIEMANDTEYGLACAVMSRDVIKARQVAKKIRCGIKWINCSQPTMIEAPWVGMKRSGFGVDLSKDAFEAYFVKGQVTQRKTEAEPFRWYS